MRTIFSKFLLTLLILTANRQFIFGQPQNTISPKDYYDFYNSLINSDSVNEFNLSSKPSLKPIIDDSVLIFRDSSLFSRNDIQFIKQQIDEGVNFTWQDKILGAHIIKDTKIKEIFRKGTRKGWRKFNHRYKGGFSRFSIPLFSIDRKTCIIYQSNHCGSLCGGGGISAYRKINGKWTFIKTVGTIWIS